MTLSIKIFVMKVNAKKVERRFDSSTVMKYVIKALKYENGETMGNEN